MRKKAQKNAKFQVFLHCVDNQWVVGGAVIARHELFRESLSFARRMVTVGMMKGNEK
ncbi:MAG: hypothetical protein NC344_00670 [Bacteroidales bacterium]|nr:hypothetical protein [Bacteroidales bacterium]MCM1146349.1 hypothetical protein [Bacteroidales bacterium]MCM1205213.1 hypothetical protein [Bacillota bacterium]MCM1509702.1 hypothetical protein [Clostridium sp.]